MEGMVDFSTQKFYNVKYYTIIRLVIKMHRGITIKDILSPETLSSAPNNVLKPLLQSGSLDRNDLVITFNRVDKTECIKTDKDNFRIGRFISRNLFECHLLMLGIADDDIAERRMLANAKITFLTTTLKELNISIINDTEYKKLKNILYYTLMESFNREKIQSQISEMAVLESYINTTNPYIILESYLVLSLPQYQKKFALTDDDQESELFEKIKSSLMKLSQELYIHPIIKSYYTNTHIDVSIFSLTSMLSAMNYIVAYLYNESDISILITILPIFEYIIKETIARKPKKLFSDELIKKHGLQNEKSLLKSIFDSSRRIDNEKATEETLEKISKEIYSDVAKHSKELSINENIKSMLLNNSVNHHSLNFIFLYFILLLITCYMFLNTINMITTILLGSDNERNSIYSINLLFFALHFLSKTRIMNSLFIDHKIMIALSKEMDHILKKLDLSVIPISTNKKDHDHSNSNNAENYHYAPLYLLEENARGLEGKKNQRKNVSGATSPQTSVQAASLFSTHSTSSNPTFTINKSNTALISKDQSRIYITWSDPKDSDQETILQDIKDNKYSFAAKKGGQGFVIDTKSGNREKPNYKFKLLGSNNSPRWCFAYTNDVPLVDDQGNSHQVPHYHCNEDGFITKKEQTKKLKYK